MDEGCQRDFQQNVVLFGKSVADLSPPKKTETSGYQAKPQRWVFRKIVVPQNRWFIMENPIKMDDLGVPLFSETPIWYQTVTIDIVGDSRVWLLAHRNCGFWSD